LLIFPLPEAAAARGSAPVFGLASNNLSRPALAFSFAVLIKV